jgi:hypothetical protein
MHVPIMYLIIWIISQSFLFVSKSDYCGDYEEHVVLGCDVM